MRHGFGYLVQQLDLLHLLPWRRRLFRIEQEDESPLGRRLRLVLEELGPTFIKLGQMLSTRIDLFPAEVITELRKLQDEVPGIPFDTVRVQIERELDCPLEEA